FPTELNDDIGEKLRKAGNEFGATTGRPRRTGWLDLPALKDTILINGVTDLIMMKGDVLSGFETLNVCTHYIYRGEKIDFMPYDIVHEEVTPVYDKMKGWNTDLTGILAEKDFPQQLSDYISYIEDNTK